MPQLLRVLMLEDWPDDARLIIHELRCAGFEPIGECVETESEFLAQLSPALDVILADYHQPQFDALRALRLVQERVPEVPVIVLTGALGDESAVECIKQGACDYLLKDRLARLGPAVTRALDHKRACADQRRADQTITRQSRDLVQSEDVLRDQTQVLKSILDSMGDGVIVADQTGAFILFNPAAERIIGIGQTDTTPDEWSKHYGLYLPDQVTLYPPESLPLARAIRGEEVNSAEIFVRHAATLAGIWINVTARPLRDEEGRLRGGIVVFQEITARKQAEQEIASLNTQLIRRLERLAALRRIDMAITANLDVRLTFDVCLDQILLQLHVSAADILLYDPHTQTLEYAAGKGFRGTALRQAQIRLDQCGVGRVARERNALHISDLAKAMETFVRAPLFAEEGFVAYHAVPLTAKGQLKGVLEVFDRTVCEPDPEWLDFLETLAGQAAIALDNASLFERLQCANAELMLAYDATILGWSCALDLRDKETEGHSQRVTEMTVRLARTMGMSDAELVHVRRGGLLHDIGKMGIPDAILLKAGPLTDDEWQIMRRHPTYAFEWLAPIAFLRAALDIPYCHHEKWDGTGYPRGLKGEQIPKAARIFAAVDIWDALSSARPYREAWPAERVSKHIASLAGSHLDPAVVQAFLQHGHRPVPTSSVVASSRGNHSRLRQGKGDRRAKKTTDRNAASDVPPLG
jgi:HD-GYP domain-containing protein (c-di-GMP phosphodiesterase class II)/DNA-binding NarL/FixJ family response regulator